MAGPMPMLFPPPTAQNSLKYILATRCPTGISEQLIAIALKEILKDLRFIHQNIGAHRHIDSTMIGVYWNESHLFHNTLRLGHDLETYVQNLESPDPEGYAFDFRCVGIVAMELAYGPFPVELNYHQLNAMADNLVRILLLKLQIAGRDKKIKRMPNELEMLLDDLFVDRQEQALKIEAKGGVLQWVRSQYKDLGIKMEGSPHPDCEKEFSKGFLEVVLMLLDQDHFTPIQGILDHHFLTTSKSMVYFQYILRNLKLKID